MDTIPFMWFEPFWTLFVPKSYILCTKWHFNRNIGPCPTKSSQNRAFVDGLPTKSGRNPAEIGFLGSSTDKIRSKSGFVDGRTTKSGRIRVLLMVARQISVEIGFCWWSHDKIRSNSVHASPWPPTSIPRWQRFAMTTHFDTPVATLRHDHPLR